MTQADLVRRQAGERESVMPRSRILVADPDDRQLNCFRELIYHGAWDVVFATNGVECMARLHDYRPDVLVLEPEMPWGGGSGVLACLRENLDLPFIPVIVLTNGHNPAEQSQVLKYSVEDFLIKPVCLETLAQRIRMTLQYAMQEKSR